MLTDGTPQGTPANYGRPGWMVVQEILDKLPETDWLPLLAWVEQRARQRQDKEQLLAIQEWRRVKGK
jgi:hypothetical protein